MIKLTSTLKNEKDLDVLLSKVIPTIETNEEGLQKYGEVAFAITLLANLPIEIFQKRRKEVGSLKLTLGKMLKELEVKLNLTDSIGKYSQLYSAAFGLRFVDRLLKAELPNTQLPVESTPSDKTSEKSEGEEKPNEVELVHPMNQPI